VWISPRLSPTHSLAQGLPIHSLAQGLPVLHPTLQSSRLHPAPAVHAVRRSWYTGSFLHFDEQGMVPKGIASDVASDSAPCCWRDCQHYLSFPFFVSVPRFLSLCAFRCYSRRGQKENSGRRGARGGVAVARAELLTEVPRHLVPAHSVTSMQVCVCVCVCLRERESEYLCVCV